jgi:Terminase large subunit, T4likevirus-type, N-terminal/Terminase RNaseH-like domain
VITLKNNQEINIIKAPYQRTAYTEQQIIEIARCTDPVTGPQYFLDNYFYIQHPTKGSMQYRPWDYQKRLIDTYHKYRYSISLMPRQTGKSTTAAGYLLWTAMFVPDSTILVAAHKYLGAQEIMQRIRYAYENCPDFVRAGVTNYNKGSLEFENGSRIVSQTTTENTGRGMSISLLYCDEFSFVRPTIAEEFWTSISPTLATGGKCIITSTPNSDEDQFAMIWKQANKCFDEYGNETELGQNGFKTYRSYWNEHPERDEAWAANMKAQLGEERFKREIDCEFIIFDETLINPLHLTELSGVDPIEKQGQVRWYKKPEKDRTYVVALDPSLGTGSDPAALQVYELPGLKQVAEWSHNKTPIQRQIVIMKEICKYLADTVSSNNVYYSVENNTIGEAALISIDELGEENISGIFLSEPHRPGASKRYRKGFNTTNRSKLAACAKLKSLIETRRMIISSKMLISELKSFVASGQSYAAKIGEHDDLVMSTILAVRMMQMLQNFDAVLDQEMRDNVDIFQEPMPFVAVF